MDGHYFLIDQSAHTSIPIYPFILDLPPAVSPVPDFMLLVYTGIALPYPLPNPIPVPHTGIPYRYRPYCSPHIMYPCNLVQAGWFYHVVATDKVCYQCSVVCDDDNCNEQSIFRSPIPPTSFSFPIVTSLLPSIPHYP